MDDKDIVVAWMIVLAIVAAGAAAAAVIFYGKRLEENQRLKSQLADSVLDMEAMNGLYHSQTESFRGQVRELEAEKREAQNACERLRLSEEIEREARIRAEKELSEARRQRDVAQKERSEANEAAAQAGRNIDALSGECTKLSSIVNGFMTTAKEAQRQLDVMMPSKPTANFGHFLSTGQWIAEPKKND